MIVEETKEADKTTCQATHKISRGIHDKVTFIGLFDGIDALVISMPKYFLQTMVV